MAPPEKAIRSDNFSKQMPYIPERSVCDKMAKVIAAYFYSLALPCTPIAQLH